MRTQISKEFECLFKPEKVDIDRQGSGAESFLTSLAERFGFLYEPGAEQVDTRRVCKYDSPENFLYANALHGKLITYQRDGLPITKMTLKLLSQIPELVFEQLKKGKRGLVYPAKNYRKYSRIKVEQDLIYTYSQIAISGTSWIDGVHNWPDLGALAGYFPNLDGLGGFDPAAPLLPLRAHELLLIDNPAISIPIKKDPQPIDSSLELRFKDGKLHLVEMSLRVIKTRKSKWDLKLLAELTRIYARMHRSDMVADEEDYYRFYAYPMLSK